MEQVDVIIIGAGAAGLMCAIEAGKRQRKVLVLDHANKPGKKILMSGGGRCNFTNYHIHPDRYQSHNPHFCKSALSRYTQWDFLALVNKHQIPFYEKTQGQLFCSNKASDIVTMLLAECGQGRVNIHLNTKVAELEPLATGFKLSTSRGHLYCDSLVIASGGLSIPTMGASPFGYKVAEQFGIKVWPTRAGLVPFTLQPEDKDRLACLSGIAVDCLANNPRQSFRENLLFTHRGISGPAILQLSSYWQPGEAVKLDLLPAISLAEELQQCKLQQPQRQVKNALLEYLPKRVIETFLSQESAEKRLQALTLNEVKQIALQFHNWCLKPNGTEGYRTAEVTLGGVDCDAISSKTMAVNKIPGLYFIGEVLDVTGWLGGYNFQWAWSSGWAAGQVV